MSDDCASNDSRSNKRTRFVEANRSVRESHHDNKKSPLAAAKTYVEAFAATLEDESLTSIVVSAAVAFLAQRSTLFYKERKLSSMKNNDNSIPAPARVNISLQVMEDAKKLVEYSELTLEVTDVITECQVKFKQLIVKATELNIKQMKIDILKLFVKEVRIISQAFIVYFDTKNYDADKCVVDLLNKNWDELTTFLSTTKEELWEIYKEFHILDRVPQPTPQPTEATRNPVPPTAAGHSVSPHFIRWVNSTIVENAEEGMDDGATATMAGAVHAFHHTALLNRIKEAVKAVFSKGWTTFAVQFEKNETTARMKKLALEQALSNKADAVSTILAAEPSIDDSTLERVIEKKLEAKMNAYKKQIEKLEKQVARHKSQKSPKNERRGRAGASEKKKSGKRTSSKETKTSTKPTSTKATKETKNILKSPSRGGKAADADNDSTKKSNETKRSRSKGKSKQKSKPSPTEKNKSSARSKKK